VSSLQDHSIDSGDTSETSLVFWLQSDLALQDAYGQPVLMPSAEHFGIDGELDTQRTFLRFRNYSPYNGYRRSYDNVRQVITQGSIITFQLNAPVSDEVKNSWLSGIGLYRESGLGQVLINHPLLLNTVPTPPAIQAVQDVLGEPPNHPMAKWLLSQAQSGGQQQRLREKAEQCGRELDALYKAARRYAGESSGVVIGPGRSQWGKISEIAKQYASGGQSDELFFALFDVSNNQAICSHTDAAWKTATGPAAADNFTDWLKGHLEKEKDNPGLLAANLAQIARTVVAKQEAVQ
jgi:CRISPR-associated protein Csx10